MKAGAEQQIYMRTLILNVDRDNDYGEKVGITGPILGYAECYNAAIKLITSDPEDSDANALFGAIRHYEELQRQGKDVDIGLITGDVDVGTHSDEILSAQLEEMLQQGTFDDLILVTDGAEDDYIVPVIVSRIKIRYVKHIMVRHNQNIESLYYYIVRGLKDKKLVNKFIIPLGLVFLTYGVVSLGFILYSIFAAKVQFVDPSLGAVTFVTIVLGAYFVERGFELGKFAKKLLGSVREYAQETRILFLSYVISSMLIFAGLASSFAIARRTDHSALDGLLIFLSLFTWWIYAAVFAREVGTAVDMASSKKAGIQRIWYGLMFSLSIAFIVYGMINYIRFILGFITFSYAIVSVFFLVMGLVIAMLSSMVHKYYGQSGESRSVGSSGNSSFFDEK